jgi:hypothetical protein
MPPTVGGLREFFRRSQKTEISQPRRLKSIFSNVNRDLWREPRLTTTEEPLLAKLNERLEDDKRQIAKGKFMMLDPASTF